LSPWFFVIALALIVGAGFWWARGALVVCLMIPISIIGTFMVMQLMGRTLNVISLAGLAFAIGMLVDNAVVVLENIYRRHDELGEPPFTAAIRGGQEVWGALVSSSLTTVAVFLPIVFVQQEAGQLFRDIALAIATSTLISLFVGMAIIPTAAARLIGNRKEDRQIAPPKKRWYDHAADRFVEMTVGVNAWIQHGVLRRLVTCGVILGLALFFTWALWPKVEYLPTGNRNFVFGTLVPPPGYNIDQLMEMGAQIEGDLKPYWDVDPDSPEAAALDYPAIDDFFFAARGRRVFMGMRAHDQQRAGDLLPLIQKVGAKLPGTFVVAKQSSLFERGASAGRTIEVEIAGPDLETLVDLGGRILSEVKQKFPEGTQVRPVPSLDLSSPELHIEPKLVQSAEMGVTSTSLGYAANAFVDGAYAGDYFLEGDKIDLTIIGQSRLSDSSQAIRSLPVATPLGQLVPLEALADVKLASGPEQINHRERVRAIMIEVSPPEELPLQDAMERLESEIVGPIESSEEFPSGYRIQLAGTADKLRDAWSALQFNLLLALLITYLLMAALFESWTYPLVLILSIPTGAVGGVIGLKLLNLFVFQSLDVLTMLGFVILIGTVVNNPILIVHQALTLMKEQAMPLREATLDSVRTRIRPIFMTTVTTVIGLAPLVIFPGAGSELYRGIGSVLLGGLAVSTIVTLVLVPVMFTLAAELRGWSIRLAGFDDGPTSENDLPSREEPAEKRAPVVASPPVSRPPEERETPPPREYVVAETTAGN
jgi:HAE1 family hydrophobic/amphiphilic exporter-1